MVRISVALDILISMMKLYIKELFQATLIQKAMDEIYV